LTRVEATVLVGMISYVMTVNLVDGLPTVKSKTKETPDR
jgi:hypothetical protein